VTKVKSPIQKAKSPVQKPQPSKKAVEHVEEEESEEAPKAVEEAEEEEGKTYEVIVKGLSFQAYENDVKELFEPFGNVVNVKLLTRDDGKSKGLAFIRFSKKASFDKALELNGTDHFGRNITVEEAQGKSNDGGFKKPGNFNNNQGGFNKFQPQTNADIQTSTLFIGGLSFNSTQESISAHFSSIGDVVRARVVTDKETGKVFFSLFSPEDSVTLSSMTSRLPKRLTTL
jgi:nucleolin